MNDLYYKRAAEVSEFMMELSKKFPDRWDKAYKTGGAVMPFGDGQHWLGGMKMESQKNPQGS